MNYTSTPQIVIKGDGTGAEAVAMVTGGRIDSIRMIKPGKNYTYADVFIVGGDGMYASATAKIQRKLSKIVAYYYDDNTGEKITFSTDVGMIDYDAGRVTITSTPIVISRVIENPFYDTNVLTVNAISESEVIYPLRNKILSIDMYNGQSVQLDMIPEK